MSSEEEGKALGHSEFWDERYTKADGDKPTHEWFRTFDALEPFFGKYLFKERGDAGKTGKMLHLGSGDSVRSPVSPFPLQTTPNHVKPNPHHQTVPYDLLERGYTNQICLDFSKVVVDLMRSRHSNKSQVVWKVGDVRDMTDIESQSIDVAFDKGTLDAMIYGSPWSPPDEVLDNSGRYMKEVR